MFETIKISMAKSVFIRSTYSCIRALACHNNAFPCCQIYVLFPTFTFCNYRAERARLNLFLSVFGFSHNKLRPTLCVYSPLHKEHSILSMCEVV